MSLSDHQWRFLRDKSLLVLYAERLGYKVTEDWGFRPRWVQAVFYYASLRSRVQDLLAEYGIKEKLPASDASPWRGQHPKKLATDLNLFAWNGEKWVYLTATEHHRPLGEFWESLDPLNRWGGRFDDGNHYERQESPWRDEGRTA